MIVAKQNGSKQKSGLSDKGINLFRDEVVSPWAKSKGDKCDDPDSYRGAMWGNDAAMINCPDYYPEALANQLIIESANQKMGSCAAMMGQWWGNQVAM